MLKKKKKFKLIFILMQLSEKQEAGKVKSWDRVKSWVISENCENFWKLRTMKHERPNSTILKSVRENERAKI